MNEIGCNETTTFRSIHFQNEMQAITQTPYTISVCVCVARVWANTTSERERVWVCGKNLIKIHAKEIKVNRFSLRPLWWLLLRTATDDHLFT